MVVEKIIVEESAKIVIPEKGVFYNPHMRFCRSLSVVAADAFATIKGEDLRVCEPLTASGIRSIRYAKEVERIDSIVACDASRFAVKYAARNVKLNDVQDIVKVYKCDANLLMASFSRRGQRFNYIDLDPFGTPSPFFDSAVRAVEHSGLICFTATDMANLCGVHPLSCFRTYASYPIAKCGYVHETAIRVTLFALAASAARHGLYLKPLFAHFTRHYIRVYSQLFHDESKAKKVFMENVGFLYHCFKCNNRSLSKFRSIETKICDICGSKMTIAGPIWIGKIFDKKFLEVMSKSVEKYSFSDQEKIIKTIKLIAEEALGPPLYYNIPRMCKSLKVQMPKIDVLVEELKSCGFYACRTHFDPQGIRTTASTLDIIRILTSQH